MISICFYFQVHQPIRLRKDYSFFNIGNNHFYHDDKSNSEILNKVANKCYLPANYMMLELINKYGTDFKIAYSVTGVAIDQFKKFKPEVLDSFVKLAETGCVEFINETYYHSLAFLYSQTEFKKQVEKHKKMIKDLFNQNPTTFRNTELIYNNDLAKTIEGMGYKTILTEGADQILGWRSPNFVYQPANCYKLKMLLKNYRLSDDIAFRFSNRAWDGFPLMANTFADWVHSTAGQGELINLFMDYETIGEHQWEDTGIFNFFKMLPEVLLKNKDFSFKTPSEASKVLNPVSKLDIPHYISWADVERNLSAWLGNPLQDSAAEYIFKLEEDVYKTQDENLIEVWRQLQTSDHFYYMCTKWFSDGDVHKYFNPFETPYQAYITYMNVVNDLREQINNHPNFLSSL